jgi:predicted RNA-binding Zn ribbon-like protein
MKEAPGRLNVIREFVNTVDLMDEEEQLDSPAALKSWLAEHELRAAHAPIDEEDLHQAIALREALRCLLLANNGEPIAEGALKELNRIADESTLVFRFGSDGSASLEPSCEAAGDAVVAELLGVVAEAMAEGTWSRLKACRDTGCEWAFYDRSRNRSGAWCDMASCGNRAKARAFRERQRGAR